MAVYPVREDTLFVKRNLEQISLEKKKVLEVGVGNAELSLKMAEKNADVTAVDINPEAIKHAKDRFESANREADIFESNLFENVEGKYDFIVFNPPYLKGQDGIGDEEMWRGGETGLEVVEKFFEDVSGHVSENGRVWVVLSSQTDFEKLVDKFNLTQIDSEKLWFERLYLMEFR